MLISKIKMRKTTEMGLATLVLIAARPFVTESLPKG